MEPPLHLQTEKLSRAITCHTHQRWYTAIEQFQFTELFGGGRVSDHFFFLRGDYTISCPSHCCVCTCVIVN